MITPRAPEFSELEIAHLKGLVPDYLSRRSFIGNHIKLILAHRKDPEIKLSLYHITAQVAIKKYVEQEMSHQ